MTDHGGAASPRTEAENWLRLALDDLARDADLLLASMTYVPGSAQGGLFALVNADIGGARDALAATSPTRAELHRLPPPNLSLMGTVTKGAEVRPPTPAEPPRPEAHGDWCVQTIRATEHGDTLSSFMHNDRCRAEARPPEGLDAAVDPDYHPTGVVPRLLATLDAVRAAQEAPAPDGLRAILEATDWPRVRCSKCGSELLGRGWLEHHDDGSHIFYPAEARPPEGLDADRLAQALHDAAIGCLQPIALSRDVCEPDKRAGAFHRDAAAALAARLSAGGATKP